MDFEALQHLLYSNGLATFVIVSLFGAVHHWIKKARRGEATWNVLDYWFFETPGYSAATFGVLATGWLTMWGAGGTSEPNLPLLILAAWSFGYAADSSVSPRTLDMMPTNKQSGYARPGMLLWAAAAALVVLLSAGCGTLGQLFGPGEPPKVDQTLSEPAQAAQSAINEANLMIAAAANVIGNNAAAGIMTKAEAQQALDEVKRLREQARSAQAVLDLGDIGNAQTQAALINQLAAALHARVAKQARSPQ